MCKYISLVLLIGLAWGKTTIAVLDFEGKGIPKKAKILAITMIIIFVSYAILFGLKDIVLRIIVSILGLVGFLYVYFKVPVAKD